MQEKAELVFSKRNSDFHSPRENQELYKTLVEDNTNRSTNYPEPEDNYRDFLTMQNRTKASLWYKIAERIELRRSTQFPWIQISSRLHVIIGLFAMLYTITFLIGYYVIDFQEINSYLSVSFIVTLITIEALFVNSRFLRALTWVVMPGMLYTTIYWSLHSMLNLRLFFSHLPIYILEIYHVIQFVKGNEKLPWWMLLLASTSWQGYLIFMRVVKPDYYGTSFPYYYELMITIMTVGGVLTAAVFFLTDRSSRNQESDADQMILLIDDRLYVEVDA